MHQHERRPSLAQPSEPPLPTPALPRKRGRAGVGAAVAQPCVTTPFCRNAAISSAV
jgi:hypothetical protein